MHDSHVTLSGSLGLKDATRLRAELQSALETHPAVTIDASDLGDADISIVQLLVAAQKAAVASDRTLTLKADKDGVLGKLLVKSGLLDAAGRALVPEIEFWASAQGKAA